MPTYCKITSSSTIVSLYYHLKIDLSSRHEQTKLIYMPFQKLKFWCKLQKITNVAIKLCALQRVHWCVINQHEIISSCHAHDMYSEQNEEENQISKATLSTF